MNAFPYLFFRAKIIVTYGYIGMKPALYVLNLIWNILLMTFFYSKLSYTTGFDDTVLAQRLWPLTKSQKHSRKAFNKLL